MSSSAKRRSDARRKSSHKRLISEESLSPSQRSSTDLNPDQASKTDLFHYGRHKNEEKEREAEYVEKLRSKPVAAPERYTTMLGPDAPKPKKIEMPVDKQEHKLSNKARKRYNTKRARIKNGGRFNSKQPKELTAEQIEARNKSKWDRL